MSIASLETRIHLHQPDPGLALPRHWHDFVAQRMPPALSYHLDWLRILAKSLGHIPHSLEATRGGQTIGLLPLSYVRSLLFGRFLVSLPYLNVGGVVAEDPETASLLIDKALDLAQRLDVKHLELRHERPVDHPRLLTRDDLKVHMRRPLPDSPETLWKQLKPEVRNQVRKAEKHALAIRFGGIELLEAFYDVFARNMRDLGTPVYPRGLFAETLNTFPGKAELAVVTLEKTPIAAAILLHGAGVTEVPSASSLRSHSATCANMFLYRHLLDRAIARNQHTFDFGRSNPDSGTYRFKKQWGACPHPASWQYYVRHGSATDLRRDNPRYNRFIRIWKSLPVPLARLLGPGIVRGIP